MKITRENYEVVFIDYIDGNLSAQEVADLFLFLELHPELKEEFEKFSPVILPDVDEPFPFKNEIRKNLINDENLNDLLIAQIEGDLDVESEKQLNSYLQQNPDKVKDQALFQLTRLQPGNEVYDNKSDLKQPIPISFNSSRNMYYAAAAVILLMLITGAYFMYTRNMNKNVMQVADKNTPAIQTQESTSVDDSIQNPRKDSVNSSQPTPVQQKIQAPVDEPIRTIHNIPTASNLPASHKNNQQQNKLEEVSPVQQSLEPQPVEVAQQIQETPAPVNQQKENPVVNPNVSQAPVLAAAPSQKAPEQYKTVWQALKDASGKELKKAAGNDELNETALASPGVKTKSRLRNILGKGIEKISNDKIKINTHYDVDGDVMAYTFSAGDLKVEKK